MKIVKHILPDTFILIIQPIIGGVFLQNQSTFTGSDKRVVLSIGIKY